MWNIGTDRYAPASFSDEFKAAVRAKLDDALAHDLDLSCDINTLQKPIAKLPDR